MNLDWISKLKFDEKGLIPAIIQDTKTGEVLMVAYMNKDTVKMSVETGKATFWSRSRNKLWIKGETSGNFLFIKELYYDCDMDTLLFKVEPKGPACHTGNRTCFFTKVDI
jgi:phosphoribosyl-ATP pyrophosphohydrolase/phosphoribosyl-AMP cyclohydrolase